MTMHKTPAEMADEYVARIDSSVLEILVVFGELDELPLSMRPRALDCLEDRMIAQAVQIGKEWGHECVDGSRARKTAITLNFIAARKEDLAKPYTTLFDKEYRTMADQTSVEELVTCFVKASAQLEKEAKIIANARLTTATQQQKLNKRAAGRRLRIRKGPGL